MSAHYSQWAISLDWEKSVDRKRRTSRSRSRVKDRQDSRIMQKEHGSGYPHKKGGFAWEQVLSSGRPRAGWGLHSWGATKYESGSAWVGELRHFTLSPWASPGLGDDVSFLTIGAPERLLASTKHLYPVLLHLWTHHEQTQGLKAAYPLRYLCFFLGSAKLHLHLFR